MNNIEDYSLTVIHQYWDTYLKYLKDNDQIDITINPNYKLNFR